MKKAAAIFLSVLLIFSLTSCSFLSKEPTTSTNTEIETPIDATNNNNEENLVDENEKEPEKEPEAEKENTKPQEQTGINIFYTPLESEQYYQYSFLNDNQKALYISFCKAAESFENYIDTTKYSLTEAEVKRVHAAFLADNPQYFYIAKACSYVINSSKNYITEFALAYYDGENTDIFNAKGDLMAGADRNKIKLQITDFNKKINAILSAIPENTTELERERIIYEYITDTVTYDKPTAAAYEKGEDVFSESFTAYGALIKGKAVCEGYVKLLQILCYKLGISVTPVEGGGNMAHMWAAINIDGKWYMVDPTWDDADNQLVCYYKYFNVPENIMREDHIFSSGLLSVPRCDNSAAAFYYNYAFIIKGNKPPENYKDLINSAVSRSAKYLYVYRGINHVDLRNFIDNQIYSGEIGEYISSLNIELFKEYYHTDDYYFIPIVAADNF